MANDASSHLCSVRTYRNVGLVFTALLAALFLGQWAWYGSEAAAAHQDLLQRERALLVEESMSGPAGDRFGRRAIIAGQRQAALERYERYVKSQQAALARAQFWPLAFLILWATFGLAIWGKRLIRPDRPVTR